MLVQTAANYIKNGGALKAAIDNVVHEKPANTNLARNNVIAGLAGVGAGLTSSTAAGNVLSDGGKTETVWSNSIDSTGRITEMVTKEPFDIATNNFLKETGIGIGSEVFTNTLDN